MLNIGLGCSSFWRQPYKTNGLCPIVFPYECDSADFGILDSRSVFLSGEWISTHNFSLANMFFIFLHIRHPNQDKYLELCWKENEVQYFLLHMTNVRMCTIAQVQMKIWGPANSDSGYTSLFANAIMENFFFSWSHSLKIIVYFQFLLVENCPYNH